VNFKLLQAAGYLTAAFSISWAIYFVPEYFWLEKITADWSAGLLDLMGIVAYSWVSGSKAFVNEFEISQECTGIQVIGVFAGILIPLPRVGWKRKTLALAVVAASVFGANLIRIALQIWLLYAGIFPWSWIHYPGGLILGVISVAFLLVAADRFIPEIGDFAGSVIESLLAGVKVAGKANCSTISFPYSKRLHPFLTADSSLEEEP